jgi:hypothetical protein
MSVMEMLGGGGPPPGPPLEGPAPGGEAEGAPPDLAALLGGGPPPGGPPEGQLPPPTPEGGEGAGEIDSLKGLLGMGQDYMQIPGVTEGEKAQMMKALNIIQKLLADNEKMEDQVMGGSQAQRKALAPRG